MNQRKYAILKWMLNVGAKPSELAKRLKLDLADVVAVQSTNSFDDYEEAHRSGSMDELMRQFMKGTGLGL